MFQRSPTRAGGNETSVAVNYTDLRGLLGVTLLTDRYGWNANAFPCTDRGVHFSAETNGFLYTSQRYSVVTSQSLFLVFQDVPRDFHRSAWPRRDGVCASVLFIAHFCQPSMHVKHVFQAKLAEFHCTGVVDQARLSAQCRWS